MEYCLPVFRALRAEAHEVREKEEEEMCHQVSLPSDLLFFHFSRCPIVAPLVSQSVSQFLCCQFAFRELPFLFFCLLFLLLLQFPTTTHHHHHHWPSLQCSSSSSSGILLGEQLLEKMFSQSNRGRRSCWSIEYKS